MRTPHRCGRETLEELSRARHDDCKSEPPQTAAHHVHADQTGHQKIYVTRAGFSDLLFADVGHVGAAHATLENIGDEQSGGATFRSRRIESIFERVVYRSDD